MTRAPASPARIATYVAVPVALIVGVVTAVVISRVPVQSDTPAGTTAAITNVAPTSAGAGAALCKDLLDALPASVGELTQRPVPGNSVAAGWGDPPVVLVCGVPKPEGLVATSELSGVNNVSWLVKNAIDTSSYGIPGENTVWTAVDRKVYVTVAIPNSQDNPSVMSPLSTVIDKVVPLA